MKTKFFSLIDIKENEELQSDCESLAMLSGVDATQLMNVYREIESVRTSKAQHDVMLRSSTQFGLEPAILVRALRVLKAVSTAFLDPRFKDDTPEGLAEDLASVASKDSSPRSYFATVIRQLKAYATNERPAVRAQFFESAVIPTLYDFSGSIDIRPVFDRTELASDDSYDPQLLGVVPAVVLRIETNSVNDDGRVFQLREEQLDQMVDQLNNLRKELAKAKAALKLKE